MNSMSHENRGDDRGEDSGKNRGENRVTMLCEYAVRVCCVR